MEYPNYYYEQNDRQEQPQNPPPRRGIGGYIVTAVVFTIIGALLATILMPSLYEIAEGTQPAVPTAQPGLVSPEATPTPAQQPAETERPAYTPNPTTRPMPELNGESPVIGNAANPIPDIVEQVSAGVLGVINYAYIKDFGGSYVERDTGSAFLISKDGYIVTRLYEEVEGTPPPEPEGTRVY